MQRFGFIHDMMDVKVLILFAMARVESPITVQEIYELCYQDDCLSYFDVCTAIPEMVNSGHLEATDDERYIITEKGRKDGALTADSIAFTVKQKAENAVIRFNRKVRRSNFIKSRVILKENGESSVVMSLDEESGNLMTLELVAPDQKQAIRISRLFEKKADVIYHLIMTELSDAETDLED